MKRRIRLTEEDLHRIVKESVNRILNEDLANYSPYRGIYIGGLEDLGVPIKILKSKIDACIEKGWSTDKIQRALDWWAYQEREDYKYKW